MRDHKSLFSASNIPLLFIFWRLYFAWKPEKTNLHVILRVLSSILKQIPMTQTSLGYSYSVPNICYHYDDYDRDQHDDYQHDDHDHHFYDYIIITTNGNNSETKTIIMI